MKSWLCGIGVLCICAGIGFSSPAQGQCYKDQFDVDFVFSTLDTVVADLLPTWRDYQDPGGSTIPGAWHDVQYQTSPNFGGADNDANNIDDDDHFDLLGAILDGDLTQVLSGLNPSDVSAIRAAFAANAAYVQTLQLTLNNVSVQAYGLSGTTDITTGANDVCVKLGFTTLCVSQFVDNFEGVPTLWQLLEDQSPLFKQGLVNLIAGYMTIGETSGTEHLRSLFRVIIQTVLRDVLPKILGELKTEDIHLELDLDGTAIVIDIPGSEIDNTINNFVGHFNCSEFQCKSALLGAAGDLNHDGTTNYDSYVAASRNRQDWMINESIDNPPLQITTQPASQKVGSGTPVMFFIEQAGGVSGTPDAYRWDEIKIDDFSSISTPSTAATLRIAYPLPTTDPRYFTVSICDALWSRRSAPAKFEVTLAPLEVTLQPVGASNLVPTEDSHTMTVAARGGSALPTYQWQKFDGVTWQDMPGETGTSLVLSPIQVTDAADYACKVTSGTEVVMSNAATITILDRIRFEPHPEGGGAYVGDPFTFTAYVGGVPVGEVHYQWRFNGVNIEGATAFTYTIESATLDNTGNYSCVIEDDLYTVTSHDAALVVADHLSITDQPDAGAGILGYDFTFVVGISGGLGDIHFQWQRDGANVGPDSATYLLKPLTEIDGGSYVCVISDSRESVTTDPALLQVFPPFNFLAQPEGALKHTGESHTFSVSIDGGSPPYGYQWRKDGQNLPYTDSSFTLENMQPSDSGVYTCFVTDQNAGATSEPATLQVANWMSFIDQPQTGTVYRGFTYTFHVTVDGGLGTVNYAWFKKVGALNINLAVNSPTLTLSNVLSDTAGQYFCRVTDNFENIESDVATLTVVEPLQFSVQPAPTYRFEGADARFEVTTSGGLGTIDFQWYRDGTPVGENSNVLIIPDVTKASMGSYHCEATDDVMTTPSDAAPLTVFRALPAQGVTLMANPINGQLVVPPVATGATGMAFGSLQPVPGSDAYTFSLSGTHSVSGANGMTINYGLAGVNGPVVFSLGNPSNIAIYRIIENGKAAEIMAGLYYVLIKSPTYPDGEVRGQIQAAVSERTLTINVVGGGSTTPAPGAHMFYDGEYAQVSAVNTAGWAFDYWEGDVVVNTAYNANQTLLMNQDRTITAHFIEVVAEGEGEGLVEGEGEGPLEGEGEGPLEGEGEGPLEGEGEGPLEGEGEGPAEGEGEGPAEGETCVLAECPDFDSLGSSFYGTLSSSFDWNTVDLDESGIPDSWEVALFAEGLCRQGGGFGQDLLCAYLANRDELQNEASFPALQTFRDVIAALITMSDEGLGAVRNLGLTGVYTVFKIEGDVAPFSANGDPDGDLLTNLIEYTRVVSASGDRAAYVTAALTPDVVEGEGDGGSDIHTADQNGNHVIELTELLRVIQFFNLRGYYCVTPPATSEDGFLPGTGTAHSCTPHMTDYNPQDWQISLTELLRLIQFFNLRGYHVCEVGEDGFCPGAAS